MIDYLRRVWHPKASRWIDISVDAMRLEDAIFWHQYIQPRIRKIGFEEDKAGLPRSRADHAWNWPTFLIAFAPAQRATGRRCQALTINIEGEGRAIPAGMLLLIEDYPWWSRSTLAGRRGSSTFAWFLSSAPHAVLKESPLHIPEPPSLGHALIDIALVTSLNRGHKGRMWLHASPLGGQRLFDFYVKMGLRAIPEGVRVPSIRNPLAGIPSDGRYCYTDSKIAKSLTSALNTNR